jgi:SpoVK/Ycf46/Vps4 family AAA+-type ATPase
VAACIMFFDKLDSITNARGGSSGDVTESDAVVWVIKCLTRFQQKWTARAQRKNVFIIGATNCPDQIDSGLLHPGRLVQLIASAAKRTSTRVKGPDKQIQIVFSKIRRILIYYNIKLVDDSYVI